MARFRWLLVVLSAFALIVSACSSDDSETDAGDDDTEQPADDTDSADDDADDAAGAEDEDMDEDMEVSCGSNTEGDVRGLDKEAGTIKLGTSQPISGVAATAGEGLAAGVQIKVDEINAAGGIDGCTFELVVYDDLFEPEQMVINVRKMIDEDEVYGFVGTAGSANIPSTYPAITAAGTPLWGPVSPPDEDIQEVYLANPSRTDQGRICIDYFAEQGVTSMSTIGQNTVLGDEAFAATEMQAPLHGIEILAQEEVEVLTTNVATAVLAAVEADADAVLTALDNAQNGLVFDQFLEAGYSPLICSDGGSAGVGGQNTVSLANPDAVDGYLAAMQVALPDSDDPFVQTWSAAWDAYDGEFKDNGDAAFSLQTYSIASGFFELMDRLDGNYAYDNFHAVAEGLVDDPIFVPSMPPVSCGPLPGGHTCAIGAGVAVYDSATETWAQVRDFQSAQS